MKIWRCSIGLFERFWRVWREPSDRQMPQPMGIPKRARATVKMLAPGASPSEPEASDTGKDDEPVRLQSYSAEEVWRRKDFATFTAADFARARDAIAKLTWNPGVRLTRRWSAGGRGAVDLRRVLRVNLKHGGELIAVPHRTRRIAPRPLILICDVSGSMEPYNPHAPAVCACAGGGPSPNRGLRVFDPADEGDAPVRLA
jgi:uncharacterized protein with von Willebrand factor type A (vWA) domain